MKQEQLAWELVKNLAEQGFNIWETLDFVFGIECEIIRLENVS